MSITDPTIGEITMFGGNFAPRQWAFCSGQLLPIAQNSALFSIIGTIYGGDGRTTMGLPDLRGRFPRHPGNGAGISPVQLGQRGGIENQQLGINNLPSHAHPHTHTANVHAEQRVGNEGTPKDNVFAVSANTIYHDVDASREDILMHPNTVTMSTDSSNAGGNQSFTVMNPFQGINFIIALYGTYPSRS